MSTFWIMAVAVGLYIAISEGVKLAVKHRMRKFEQEQALSDYLNKD